MIVPIRPFSSTLMDIVNPSTWDSVLQFVADPLDLDFSEKAGVTRTLIQVPTPPVSTQ